MNSPRDGGGTEFEVGYEDAFGKHISDPTKNEVDLPGHYPFSPERWRLFVDGTRQFVQYGSVSQYNDLVGSHELIPAQGETVTLRTAERFRYIVGYVLEPSFALGLSRSLETGDKVVFGYGNTDLENDMADADGWFFIYTPDLADNEIKVAEYRAGTEVDAKVVDIEKGITIWKRLAIRLNWYGVGNAEFIETYTNKGLQENDIIGRTSVDDDKGPEIGNHHIEFSVQRGASSSALTFEVGSAAMQTLGSPRSQLRGKSAYFNRTSGTANAWYPLIAFRVRSSLQDVLNVQLRELNLLSFSSDAAIEGVVLAFDSSKVSFSSGSWFTPETWSEQNNALEAHDNVSAIAANDGTSAAAPSNPGGHQIGYAVLTPTDQQFQKGASSTNLDVKRNLPSGDIAVVCVKSSLTGDVGFTVNWEQDW